MTIQRNGTQLVSKGPAEHFVGNVRVEPLFVSPGPGRVRGASVTFEPGARSAWHTHPRGQTLIVTAGLGWHQCEGEAREEIRPGDVIICEPGKRHWHGATDKTAMTHLSIVEPDADGKVIEWMEQVSDEQYFAR